MEEKKVANSVQLFIHLVKKLKIATIKESTCWNVSLSKDKKVASSLILYVFRMTYTKSSQVVITLLAST